MPFAHLFSPLLWLLTLTQIVGVATVIDGDTIEIRGQRIRLHGIDAPEASQRCTDGLGQDIRCGQQAALRLDSLLRGKNCQCQVLDTDRYGRKIAICTVDETNINEWMVIQGQALAYRKYSSDYIAAEKIAKETQIGIWKYEFEEPWSYRNSKRNGKSKDSHKATRRVGAAIPMSSVTSQTVDGCLIKGNITSNGERIYHPPSSPWYSRTKISESKGERWFCSELEARRAGWRCADY